MKKISLTTALFVLTCASSFAVVKDATEVFKRWIEIQNAIADVEFQDLSTNINDQFAQDFKTTYEAQLKVFNKQLPFITSFSGGTITEYGYQLRAPLSDTFTENLQKIYSLCDNDIAGLLNFLSANNLLQDTKYGLAHDLIEQYNGITTLFFSGNTIQRKQELLFNLANRLAEYAFGPNFSTVTQRMLVDQSQHQTLRYLYSIIWQQLAGFGWKNWHCTALDNLSEAAAAGKTVVYIAGGSDIYQLIKNGVYNIINIDPQLPSQPKYYTNDWEFLVFGFPDDKIIFNDPKNRIIMNRKSFKKTGAIFKARIATGQVIPVEESETEWDIIGSDFKKLGSYVIKRRFCTQQDFNLTADQVLLSSFNELYFICLPETLGGWGIDVAQLPSNFTMHIKQLRNPVSRDMVMNVHTATLLNTTDLNYIALGTCIN